MNAYFDLLEEIRKRPGLYIGNPSISNLFMFLNGYRFARYQLGLPISVEEKLFQEFQPWLQGKFSVKNSHSWSQLILFHSADERDAFERFFRLLQEFLQSHQTGLRMHQNEAILEPA